MRARVRFAGRMVEFIDRRDAVRWLEDIAGRGTHVVYAIYGPEGCGKTALLKQAAATLEGYGYAVVHINPLAEAVDEKLSVSEELREFIRELGAVLLGDASRLVEKAVELLYIAVRRGFKRKIALLADDVLQAVGLDRAELLVKSLLNLIEHPSIEYERIAVLVASSEGVTRERVGRHRWAWVYTMWNMPREGFEELYELIPRPKPPLEDAWRLSGGNPKALEELYRAGWETSRVIDMLIAGRGLAELVDSLKRVDRELLQAAVEDPDALRGEEAAQLRRALVEKNLIAVLPPLREPHLWVDTPPPERDLELGIGRFYAWQTPLHREAVRRALEIAPS